MATNSGLITEILTNFNLNTIPFGIIGKDSVGNWLKSHFKTKNISTENLFSISEVTTSLENRIIVDSHQVCRFDENLISDNKKFL